MCLAIPGKIISIENTEKTHESKPDPIFNTGKVSFGGIIKEISLAYTPDAQPGDYVIVHAGFALNILDEKEAAEVFEALKQAGIL